MKSVAVGFQRLYWKLPGYLLFMFQNEEKEQQEREFTEEKQRLDAKLAQGESVRFYFGTLIYFVGSVLVILQGSMQVIW